MKIRTKTNRILIALLVGCFMAPQALWAQTSSDQNPNAAKMVGDLVVARPVGLVMTVAGTAAFVISLPFTLLAGNTGQAADALMIGPAKTTFVRCLGCTNTGYSYRDIEANKARKEKNAAQEM